MVAPFLEKRQRIFSPPMIGKLTEMDPAQLVIPPEGMEIGYVAIATRQGSVNVTLKTK